MVKDILSSATDGKEIIEVGIETEGKLIWAPVMATSLYIVTKDQELNKVVAVSVRHLKEEII